MLSVAKFKVRVNEKEASVSNNVVVGTGADSNKVTLIITPPFVLGNTIKVTLGAGAVKDKAKPQNNNVELAQATTQSTTIVADATGPTITEISANDGARTQVVVTFNEAVKALDQTKFTATTNNVTQVISSATIGTGNDTNKVILTLATAFKASNTIGITLQAGAIKDNIGNESGVLSMATTVTDVSKPIIQGISATTLANTRIIVGYNEAVKDIDQAKFTVTKNSETQAISSVEIGTGSDTNKITLVLTTAFTKGDTIAITTSAGAVKDNVGNESIAINTATATSTTTVLDATLPYIMGVSANTGAPTQVVVAFSETVTSPDKTKFTVTTNSVTQTINNAVVGTGADANKVTLTLGKALVVDSIIKVTLETGAVTDTASVPNTNVQLVQATLQSTTIVSDSTIPSITEISANNKALTKVLVKFSEAVTVVDATKFKVQVEPGNGSASEATTTYASALAITANNAVAGTGVSANKVTLTLSKKFSTDNTIKVTLDAGAVKDKANPQNNNVELAQANPQSTTIVSDVIAPTISTVNANDSANTKVIVEFSKVVKALDRAKFTVTKNNEIQAINSVEIGTENNANKVTLTLEGTFKAEDVIAVTLQSGAVKDNVGNESIALSMKTLVTDVSKPVIQGISANDGGDKKIVVVAFNEAVTIKETGKFKVQVAEGTATAPDSAVVGTGADSNKVTLTLATAFAVNNTIKVTLEAGAVSDKTGNDNEALSTATATSTTTVLDATLPYIVGINANTGAPTQIVVEFSETVTSPDKTKFIVTTNSVTQTINNATVGTGDDSKRVTLTVATAFVEGNTIKVTLAAGAVSDQTNNSNAELNTATATSTITVLDSTLPYIVGVSANNEAPTQVVVEFSEAVTILDKEKIKISARQETGRRSLVSSWYYYSQKATYREGKVEVGTGSDANKITLTVGVSGTTQATFNVDNTITITLEAGAVSDTVGNGNIATDTSTTTVLDKSLPYIVGVSANDRSPTKVLVEFNKVIKHVQKDRFEIRSVGAVIPNSAVITGHERQVELTFEQPFKTSQNIEVILEAGAVSDTVGNDNEALSTATNTNTTTVLDLTGPTISRVSADDSANTKVLVEFSEVVKAIDKAKFMTTKNGTLQTIKDAVVGTGSDANKVTLTLATEFKVGDAIAITTITGAVLDNADNTNNTLLQATTQSITTVADKTQPRIEGISAHDGANVKVVVGYNEEVQNPDKSKFTVTKSGTEQTINAIEVGTGSDANKLTLTLATTFKAEDVITIITTKGAVLDSANNESVAVTSTTAVTTTVLDATLPYIVGISANDESPTKVVVEFSTAVTSPDKAKFGVTTNSVTQTISSATVGTGDDSNKVTLTLATAFVAGNTIKVTLNAGAVTDTAATPNSNVELTEATLESTTIVRDSTPSTITGISVSSEADTKIIVDFSEEVQNPDSTKFTVTKNGTAQTISSAEVGIGIAANKVTLTLSESFAIGETIQVTLLAQAVQDLAGNFNIADSTGQSKEVINVLYKPYDTAHKDKFSVGDYNNNALFGIRGGITLVDTTPQYTVSIKSKNTEIYSKTKTALANKVPTGGNFDIPVDMTYAQWAAITDNSDVTIEITIYDSTGNTKQTSTTVTARKTAAEAIYNWRDLQNMNAKLDATYTLQNDIVFPTEGTEGFSNSGFVPIGSKNNKFSGFLEGNNKTITGLYIKNSTLDYAGLFGYIQKIDTDIAVQNLTLHNTYVEANNYIGALAGYITYATVTAIASTVDSNKQTTHIIKGNSLVGGLVGDGNFGSTIEGYSTINVKGISSNIGGLLGFANGSKLRGYSTGDITGEAVDSSNIGGLVGGVSILLI